MATATQRALNRLYTAADDLASRAGSNKERAVVSTLRFHLDRGDPLAAIQKTAAYLQQLDGRPLSYGFSQAARSLLPDDLRSPRTIYEARTLTAYRALDRLLESRTIQPTARLSIPENQDTRSFAAPHAYSADLSPTPPAPLPSAPAQPLAKPGWFRKTLQRAAAITTLAAAALASDCRTYCDPRSCTADPEKDGSVAYAAHVLIEHEPLKPPKPGAPLPPPTDPRPLAPARPQNLFAFFEKHLASQTEVFRPGPAPVGMDGVPTEASKDLAAALQGSAPAPEPAAAVAKAEPTTVPAPAAAPGSLVPLSRSGTGPPGRRTDPLSGLVAEALEAELHAGKPSAPAAAPRAAPSAQPAGPDYRAIQDAALAVARAAGAYIALSADPAALTGAELDAELASIDAAQTAIQKGYQVVDRARIRPGSLADSRPELMALYQPLEAKNNEYISRRNALESLRDRRAAEPADPYTARAEIPAPHTRTPLPAPTRSVVPLPLPVEQLPSEALALPLSNPHRIEAERALTHGAYPTQDEPARATSPLARLGAALPAPIAAVAQSDPAYTTPGTGEPLPPPRPGAPLPPPTERPPIGSSVTAENTMTFVLGGRSTSYSGMREFRRTERTVTITAPPAEPAAREPPQEYTGFRRAMKSIPFLGLLF